MSKAARAFLDDPERRARSFSGLAIREDLTPTLVAAVERLAQDSVVPV